MIADLIRTLGDDGAGLTAEELADALWLAPFLPPSPAEQGPVTVAPPTPDAVPVEPVVEVSTEDAPQPPPEPDNEVVEVVAEPVVVSPSDLSLAPAEAPPPFPETRPTEPWTESVAPPTVPNKLSVMRALRPLRRRVPSRSQSELDETATAEFAAEVKAVVPVMEPVPERWLDLVLVIDQGPSMVLWQKAAEDLRVLLHRTGAFRDVRVFWLDPNDDQPLSLASGPDGGLRHSAAELIDPAGRRAFLIFSDCVGTRWSDGGMRRLLELWGATGPVAVVQPLPQALWHRAGVDVAPRVPVRFFEPAQPNDRIRDRGPAPRGPDANPDGMVVPVIQLEDRWLAAWAAAVAGQRPGPRTVAALFTRRMAVPARLRAGATGGVELARRFLAGASDGARGLAIYLAAAPLSLATMRAVQAHMMPHAASSDIAEVFLGGLLRRTTPATAKVHPDDVRYDFAPEVREELLRHLPRPQALRVLEAVSRFLGTRAGSSLSFTTLVSTADAPAVPGPLRWFAGVAGHVLGQLGGAYRRVAERMRQIADPGPPAVDPEPPPTRHKDDKDGDKVRSVSTTLTSGVDVSATMPAVGQALSGQEPDRPAEPQSSGRPPVWGGIPPRNLHFTGREDVLDHINRLLRGGDSASLVQDATQAHALHGLGGVGKTQLAIEYAWRHQSEYDVVFWVPADDPTLIRQALARLARLLKLPESNDIEQTVATVLEALRVGRPYERWLLVYDNADKPAELQPYLPVPVPSGHVLITSRNQAWAGVTKALDINVFRPEESVKLLRSRGRGIGEEEARELAEKLGHLPIALEQAAAWQAETGMPVRRYLQLFDERREQLLREGLSASNPTPVATTWQLSFEQLRQDAPAAAQLLELCAFLGPQPVSVPMLLRGGRNADLPRPLDAAIRDEFTLRRAVRDIGRYSLARIDHNRNTLQIHMLVQAVLRAQLTTEQQAKTAHSVHHLLALANPGEPDRPETWGMHAELTSHVVPSGVIDSHHSEARRVALDQVRYLYAVGDYFGSRELGERATKSWAVMLGEHDEMTLLASRHLANVLRALGEREAARDLNLSTLERFKETLGEDHGHTLATANNVGADLRLLGDFEQARRLDEHNLELHHRVFGDDVPEPSMLRSRNNLAVDHRLLGNFREAHDLDQRTAVQRAEMLGEESPETLLSYTNLVWDRYGMGAYREALALNREKLPIVERALQPGHFYRLLAQRSLAMLLRKTGDYAAALELVRGVVAEYQRRYGDEHEATLAATMTYCNSLRVMGEIDTAAAVGQKALETYRRRFGRIHPFTLTCATNMAIVLRGRKEHDQARELDERTLSELRDVLGPDHPYTLCCASNLTNDLAAFQDHAGALELSAETLDRSQRVRGDDHPYTLACAVNYALDLRAAGDDERAEQLYGETLDRLRGMLGNEHPEVVNVERGRRSECDIEPPPS